MKTNNFNITELIGNNKIPDYNYAMHIVIGIAWIVSFKNNVDVRNIAIPSTLKSRNADCRSVNDNNEF